jgi:hypothetical protein
MRLDEQDEIITDDLEKAITLKIGVHRERPLDSVISHLM